MTQNRRGQADRSERADVVVGVDGENHFESRSASCDQHMDRSEVLERQAINEKSFSCQWLAMLAALGKNWHLMAAPDANLTRKQEDEIIALLSNPRIEDAARGRWRRQNADEMA